MDIWLGGVQHHEHQIGSTRHGDDLATTPLALGGALNDTRQVQQLYVGALVLDHTRNAGQGGELIVCCGFLGKSFKIWRGRGSPSAAYPPPIPSLSGWTTLWTCPPREADQRHPRIAALQHIESLPLFALLRRFQQLGPVLGQFRLQQAQMVFGGCEKGENTLDLGTQSQF